ncbi:uncharacterized protein LOC120083238 [Benincasa hispida]|uniref:uncharacterized protein LOC120083238 n=1 Tax=Benincasa hispida TaxID=102211 RepID=UPI001900415A|nr:uncharacterized protein LOC120083238 [Benincasa hispida]
MCTQIPAFHVNISHLHASQSPLQEQQRFQLPLASFSHAPSRADTSPPQNKISPSFTTSILSHSLKIPFSFWSPMKKLYRKRGTVHPSPPIISDHLSFLPTAILTLAAALSLEDREVLAYLISSCSNDFTAVNNRSNHRGKAAHQKPPAAAKGGSDHPPAFSCDCFRCYTSYWVRWDSSPNRQLIHEIIDAYEEKLAESKAGKNNKKERKKRNSGPVSGPGEGKRSEPAAEEEELRVTEREAAEGGEEETEKGSVRRIVSFIGERIWGSWN